MAWLLPCEFVLLLSLYCTEYSKVEYDLYYRTTLCGDVIIQDDRPGIHRGSGIYWQYTLPLLSFSGRYYITGRYRYTFIPPKDLKY